MKILVTGASGFAGSHLVEALLDKGYSDITGTVYGNPGYVSTILPAKNLITVDLKQKTAVDALIKDCKPDWIFHLASFAFVGESFERAEELLENNISLQVHMLDAVKRHSPSAKMLVVGSAEEYGLSEHQDIPIHEDHPLRPVNPYAVSKITQDLLAYAYQVSYNLQLIRVRPFNHIGERQTPDFAIPAFAKQIVEIEQGRRDALQVGNLTGVRDFTDVKDMVQAYILLMEKGKVGEVYNIGTGLGVKMQDVVDQLIALSSVKDMNVEIDKVRLRPLDIPTIIADASKVKQLGWKPKISLEGTLKRVLEYWRREGLNKL